MITASKVITLSDHPDSNEITDLTEAPLQIKVDAATIASSDFCVPDSVKVYRKGESEYFITCEVIYPTHCKIRLQLLKNEPVAFLYDIKLIHYAPQIYSERTDFPRDLPHLNTVHETSPVWFCIAREGNRLLYDGGGISSLIKQLSEWFRDASAGRLDADGWEPYPRSCSYEAVIDSKSFQDKAYKSNSNRPGSSTHITELFREKENAMAIVYDKDINYPGMKIEQRSNEGFSCSRIPCLFIWGVRKNPNSEYSNTSIDTGEQLIGLFEKIKCKELADDIFNLINTKHKDYLRYGLMIIVGVWRPREIIQDIPGLAEGDARKCELLPYLLTWKAGAETKLEAAKVNTFKAFSNVSPQLFRKISGHNQDGLPVIIIGCGAIGSHISDNLIRGGTENITFIDHDSMEPHNLARHVLNNKNSLFVEKAKGLRAHVLNILPKVFETIKAYVINIIYLNNDGFKKIFKGKTSLIIDASADKRVREYLCIKSVKNKSRVIRTEISDNSKLGLISIEGSERNPRLDDLNAWLNIIAFENDDVSDWLKKSNEDSRLTSFNLGLGCASATTIMANSTISNHASAMHPVIESMRRKPIKTGNIGINVLDDEFLPKGWNWFDVPKFSNFYSKDLEWSLRVANSVYEQMALERKRSQPLETAGYLYGVWNISLKVITVLISTPPPPGISATTTSVDLPPAGKSPFERKLLSQCGKGLVVIGSWHSHPNSNPDMSSKDKATFDKLSKKHQFPARPTVMLISGKNDNGNYFDLPDAWK